MSGNLSGRLKKDKLLINTERAKQANLKLRSYKNRQNTENRKKKRHRGNQKDYRIQVEGE